MGVVQVIRGIGAQPEAMMAPSKGKWWNENEGKWIYTNLEEETKKMVDIPEDDSDLLQEIAEEIDLRASTVGGEVKDPYYYEVLEVDPKADPSAIKRKVHIVLFSLYCFHCVLKLVVITGSFQLLATTHVSPHSLVLCLGTQVPSR